jgi:hypothetical protein
MGIEELVGKTLTAIEGKVGGEQITFTDYDGNQYDMFHIPECCEVVQVEDISGDLQDLIGAPIVRAEESQSCIWPEGVAKPVWMDESFTWTFYRIATAKGLVVIRWYGSSNGWYSESVDFKKRWRPE